MPTLRRRRILWMQITSFKLTVKPLRVAVIRIICFTALFPGRCCGVLDSWGSSLISMGTVGWGWREAEGEMTADHLCTQICLHPSRDAIRGESDMGENSWLCQPAPAVQPDLYWDVKCAQASMCIKSSMEDRETWKHPRCVLFGSVCHQNLYYQEQSQIHKTMHISIPNPWTELLASNY